MIGALDKDKKNIIKNEEKSNQLKRGAGEIFAYTTPQITSF